ncbi:ORF MSV208 putative uracil DNA glycosylase UNG (vaccinia D4R), similar to Equine herpesvirus GB:U20824 [Melanoplus sanguinipes entomopoxvirus]|uniref:ORF MSV208 putative uracil DNA glycosylase UNG (Vaccinia D4R), similar to Equine herpesvirus GB:U20824 n=1 Tax=Melanoplus sanguinipes entomopoxvirus TaxID=83191 RepID=Q9YVN4_MSEPV|nr:ORF MSV208 putative uracil DNA glycosylase UNG (vaccinia D4R), similar to Equine herpesvirus GB:U20824 [Melanoplus sanguinipes entomopoxvirus]AAC97753.1 ORF MSV208 putative uracil DNA glycosylase UNG (vaccinia D4R), similar to Equine herpesvirus GB:U20824 [Melanoplus sanguinipes entomopoxvirus 'O']
MTFYDFIPDNWKCYIDKKLIIDIENRLNDKHIIKPSKENIFKCFKYFNPEHTNVVILGYRPFSLIQDGLAFSCPNEYKNKPIENKLFINEIFSNYNRLDKISDKMHKSSLECLAKQGVLLLNVNLTIGSNINDHSDIGWEYLTNDIIKKISINNDNIVFILIGSKMHDKCNIIHNIDNHFIIKTSYPSYQTLYSENSKYNVIPFINSKCFIKANEYLKIHKNIEIDWISCLI